MMTTEPGPTPVTKPAPAGYRYAGAWIRLFALVIDGLLLLAIVYVLFIVLGGVLYLAYPQAAESVLADLDSNTWPAGLLSYVVLSLVMLAWYGSWQAGIGATPGMLVLKLRVRETPTEKTTVVARGGDPQLASSLWRVRGTDRQRQH